jgi:hypothetical protein
MLYSPMDMGLCLESLCDKAGIVEKSSRKMVIAHIGLVMDFPL